MHPNEPFNSAPPPLTSPEDQRTVKELFGILLDAQEAKLSGDPEASNLSKHAQNSLQNADTDIANTVKNLLQAHNRADSGLLCESSEQVSIASTPTDMTSPIVAPPAIDRYEILEELGRGGFGVVFRAQQLEPIKRPVAIKVLRSDLATPAMVARFQAEASLLARMNHDGIARVIDAGQDQLNRPYVAMELIEGQPLLEYCEHHNLTARQCVELFMPICQAVQHAHQRAVIHRDLKPSNILVEQRDARPCPRVIDFGIAKLIESQDSAVQTMDGDRMGTPRYMSPEQRAGDTGIDTRIDVYSIGILLCEALTGQVPSIQTETNLNSKRTGRRTTRPSTLVHASSLRRLPRANELKGDLVRIVSKSLAIDPEMRYQTAGAMGDDLERFLQGHPVLAKDAGPMYRTIKFVNRHQVASVFAFLAVIALIAGGIGLAVGLDRATTSRDAAQEAFNDSERQRQRAEFVNRFILGDMLGSIDPNINQGREITVREVFDNASAKLSERVDLDIETQYATHHLIGLNYAQIGAHDEAMDSLKRAADLSDGTHGSPSRQSIEIRLDLYDIIVSNGRSGQTALTKLLDEHAEQILEPSDRLYTRVKIRTSDSINEMKLMIESLDNDPSSSPMDKLVALANLGHLYTYASMTEERMEMRRQSYELSKEIFGPEHTTTLSSLASYAAIRVAKYHDEETLDLLYKAYEPSRRLLGLEHPITLRNMRSYAFLLGRFKNLNAGIALLEENTQGYIARFGESSIGHTLTLSYLGRLLLLNNQLKEALDILERVRDDQAKQWSAGHKIHAGANIDVAMCHLALGDPESARQNAAAALECATPGGIREIQANALIARALGRLGLFDEAVVHSTNAHTAFAVLEPNDLHYFTVGEQLIDTLDELGDTAGASDIAATIQRVNVPWKP